MACSRAGGDCADRIRGPSYVGRGFFIDAAVLPPHRLISAEGGDAAATQPGISDRPTFFSHAVGSEVAIGAEQVVVLVALPYVLCRGFVRGCLAGVRSRLCRNSRQSCQAHERWNDHAHFSLFIWGGT